MRNKLIILALIATILLCIVALVACTPTYSTAKLDLRDTLFGQIEADPTKLAVTFGGSEMQLDGTTLSFGKKIKLDDLQSKLTVTYDGQTCLVYETADIDGVPCVTVVVGAEVSLPQTIRGRISTYDDSVGAIEVFGMGRKLTDVFHTGEFVVKNVFADVNLSFSCPTGMTAIYDYFYSVDSENSDITVYLYRNESQKYTIQVRDTMFNPVPLSGVSSRYDEVLSFQHIDSPLTDECAMNFGCGGNTYYEVNTPADPNLFNFAVEGYQIVRAYSNNLHGQWEGLRYICVIVAERDKEIGANDAFELAGRFSYWGYGNNPVEGVEVYANGKLCYTSTSNGNFGVSYLFEATEITFCKDGYTFWAISADGTYYFPCDSTTIPYDIDGVTIWAKPADEPQT